jgi:hypothetical protein
MTSLESAVDRFERSHFRRATAPGACSTGKNFLQVRVGLPFWESRDFRHEPLAVQQAEEPGGTPG